MCEKYVLVSSMVVVRVVWFSLREYRINVRVKALKSRDESDDAVAKRTRQARRRAFVILSLVTSSFTGPLGLAQAALTSVSPR